MQPPSGPSRRLWLQIAHVPIFASSAIFGLIRVDGGRGRFGLMNARSFGSETLLLTDVLQPEDEEFRLLAKSATRNLMLPAVDELDAFVAPELHRD